MAKKTTPKPSFLDADFMKNLTSDKINKGEIEPKVVTPVSVKVESSSIVKEEPKTTPPKTKTKSKKKDKSLLDFFEKNYTTSNSTRTTVDVSVINIIDKVSNATPKLYSVNLVSNILANWIEEHREEIQEHLDEMSKI